MANGVTLHGAWHSPFVKRVQMVLKMKGIDEYKYVEENLNLVDKSKRLLEISSNGKVPVLIHNDKKPIEDSTDIIKYIEAAFPSPSILPQDNNETISWINIDDKVIKPLWNVYWKEGDERDRFQKKAIEGLKILEKAIESKKFFGGDKIGLLDVNASFIAYGAPLLEELTQINFFTEAKFPCLFKWIENYYNDPLAKEKFPGGPLAMEYFPPKDPLLASYKVGLQSNPPRNRYAFYKAAFLESQK